VAFTSAERGTRPRVKQALVEINGWTLSALQAEFNRRSAELRVILQLSPT
jgi:hypothetical protein